MSEPESPLLVRGGQVLTMEPGVPVARADLLLEDGRIAGLGPDLDVPPETRALDATGLTVIPGLVQGHLHLCQTLFRGLADDMDLLPWLRRRVLPLEAAHNSGSMEASTRLALTELLLGGTTAFQSMESVHHTETAFQVMAESGMTALSGGCLIDGGQGFPPALVRSRREALAVQLDLARTWHGRGSLRVALCPRFVLSCSEALLSECAAAARDRGLHVHTHAAENLKELGETRRLTGNSDIAFLDRTGLLGPTTGIAHCIHVDREDTIRLRETGTQVLTCPSANLKLASGIAPVARYLDLGIPVALGADGAACNNRLDQWAEMRSLALVQKWKSGPAALPARQVLEIATLGGARALGLEKEIGSLGKGKRADLVLLDLESPWLGPGGDPYSRLVYAAGPRDIRAVVLGGRLVVEEGRLLLWDQDEAAARAREEMEKLLRRVNLGK